MTLLMQSFQPTIGLPEYGEPVSDYVMSPGHSESLAPSPESVPQQSLMPTFLPHFQDEISLFHGQVPVSITLFTVLSKSSSQTLTGSPVSPSLQMFRQEPYMQASSQNLQQLSNGLVRSQVRTAGVGKSQTESGFDSASFTSKMKSGRSWLLLAGESSSTTGGKSGKSSGPGGPGGPGISISASGGNMTTS